MVVVVGALRCAPTAAPWCARRTLVDGILWWSFCYPHRSSLTTVRGDHAKTAGRGALRCAQASGLLLIVVVGTNDGLPTAVAVWCGRRGRIAIRPYRCAVVHDEDLWTALCWLAKTRTVSIRSSIPVCDHIPPVLHRSALVPQEVSLPDSFWAAVVTHPENLPKC